MTTEYSIEIAKPIIAQKAKQFEAALRDDPARGKIRPVGYEPWMAAVIADFQRNDKLCQAAVESPETVWEALNVAAGCGLVPGSASGEFYLIPRFNGKQRRMECTFIVGYKGLTSLAYRHPRVHTVEAFLIFEGEEFSWQPGQAPTHKVRLDINRELDGDSDFPNLVGAYSLVKLTVPGGTTVDQQPLIHLMSRQEILSARKRSESFKRGFSPWKTDPVPMVRKCPLRRACSGGSVPKSVDLIMAMTSENREIARVESEVNRPSPAATANASLRAAVGLGSTIPKFELVEEAIEFVRQAGSQEAVVAISEAMSWVGEDAAIFQEAVDERLSQLG